MPTIISTFPARLALETRQGNPIDNAVDPQEDRAVREIKQEEFLKEYAMDGDPDIRPMHEPDATYNCVGFVFGARRVFISPRQVDAILREDGYASVAEDAVSVGDVVTWRSGAEYTHVGIVAHYEQFHSVRLPVILSKWGSLGEFLHPATKVPSVYGDVVEYWRVSR